MDIRILDHNAVHKLLPMGECMDVMADVLKTTARGDAINPLRTLIRFPDRSGLLGMMPAWLGSPACSGIKVVTVMPGNHGTSYDAHQGAVMLFEMKHGRPLAMMDASSITAIRTAAVSGVATRLLARDDVARLAILGSGVQAAMHLRAMREARPIAEVTVWSRSTKSAARFAERESARHSIGVRVAESVRECVAGADIICTTTSSREPVLRGEWIAPGTHVNAVGACLPACRELDTGAVVGSRLFVDRRESALKEAGDFLIPRSEGAIDDTHILGEIGELLLGAVPGRGSRDEITLFKSLGIAVEDLAAAHYLYRRAIETDTGVCVEFGGESESG